MGDCIFYIMKAKFVFLLITVGLLGFLSCEPTVPYASVKTNSRYEEIEFDNFGLRAEMGRGTGNVIAIAFTITALDSLTFWASKLQVLYDDLQLSYEIRDEGKHLKDTYLLFREDKIVIFLVKWNVFSIRKGEQIALYGPGIFQVGERLYDLDTLKFIALKTYARSY